jgi:hypothetical protein
MEIETIISCAVSKYETAHGTSNDTELEKKTL